MPTDIQERVKPKVKAKTVQQHKVTPAQSSKVGTPLLLGGLVAGLVALASMSSEAAPEPQIEYSFSLEEDEWDDRFFLDTEIKLNLEGNKFIFVNGFVLEEADTTDMIREKIEALKDDLMEDVHINEEANDIDQWYLIEQQWDAFSKAYLEEALRQQKRVPKKEPTPRYSIYSEPSAIMAGHRWFGFKDMSTDKAGVHLKEEMGKYLETGKPITTPTIREHLETRLNAYSFTAQELDLFAQEIEKWFKANPTYVVSNAPSTYKQGWTYTFVEDHVNQISWGGHTKRNLDNTLTVWDGTAEYKIFEDELVDWWQKFITTKTPEKLRLLQRLNKETLALLPKHVPTSYQSSVKPFTHNSEYQTYEVISSQNARTDCVIKHNDDGTYSLHRDPDNHIKPADLKEAIYAHRSLTRQTTPELVDKLVEAVEGTCPTWFKELTYTIAEQEGTDGNNILVVNCKLYKGLPGVRAWTGSLSLTPEALANSFEKWWETCKCEACNRAEQFESFKRIPAAIKAAAIAAKSKKE